MCIRDRYLAIKYEKELEKTLGSKEAAKDYILELYLNTISLNHGLNGVGSAAEYYFCLLYTSSHNRFR